MKQTIMKRALLAVACMVVLPFLAPAAHADSFVDFSCGGSSCSGMVMNAGGTYFTTGIGGLVQTVNGGPDYHVGTFNLLFDTSTNTISLTGNAAAGNDTLRGSIVSVTANGNPAQTQLALTVNWTTLPTDFQNYLNASAGTSVGSVIYLNANGQAASIDFAVTPTSTPEPATFTMLGAGLLGVFGLFGRKAFNPAA